MRSNKMNKKEAVEIQKIKRKQDKEQRENLIKLSLMGKWNFVFTYGVIRWGMLCALLITLFDKFILGQEIDSFDVTINIVLFGIGGLILGLWSWKNIHKKLVEK